MRGGRTKYSCHRGKKREEKSESVGVIIVREEVSSKLTWMCR